MVQYLFISTGDKPFSGTILIHEISPSHPHTWGPRGPDRCISRVIQSYRNMATFRQKQSRTCPWLVWHCGLVPHTTYDLWTSLLLFLVENSLVFLILDNSFKYINIVGVFLDFQLKGLCSTRKCVFFWVFSPETAPLMFAGYLVLPLSVILVFIK